MRETLVSLEWRSLLEQYSSHCQSAPAKLASLSIPLPQTKAESELELDITEECIHFLEENNASFLSPLVPLEEALTRLEKFLVLDGKELRGIASLSAASREAKENLEKPSFPHLQSFCQRLQELQRIEKPILYAIDEEGRVVDAASPALRSLREQERRLHSEAKELLEAVLQSAFRNGYLQDRFYDFRGDRYVIPVKAEFRHKVSGLVVESSSSQSTVFMEPANVRECNDRIKQTQMLIEEEVYRILSELSTQTAPHAPDLKIAYDVLIRIDLAMARGSFALAFAKIKGASKPSFRSHFFLEELYHPLLGFVLDHQKIIRNTFKLGPEKRVLIISGPNTGGKTVLLKAVGLCSLLARAGFYLPCAGKADIPFFTEVLSQIGDSQNIELSLSSFSGSVLQLNAILKSSSPTSLVLIDEILHATDPDEATALGRSILEALQKKQTYCIVTTHLNGLKVAASTDFENASMEFDPEEMSPTYRLRIGIPGSSRALEISQKLGLPDEIIKSARSYLSAEKVDAQQALDQLEAREKELQFLKDELLASSQELSHEKEQLQTLQQELENTKQNFRQNSLEKLRAAQREEEDALKELIEKYKSKLSHIQEKHAASEEIKRDKEQVKEHFAKTLATINEIVPEPAKSTHKEKATATLLQNHPVFIANNLGDGILLTDPKSDTKQAEVLVGNIRMKVPWGQLRPKQRLDAPPINKNSFAYSLESDCPEEINLIGKTVDDAIRELSGFLDRAVRSTRPSIRIVHGHGSGALKRAIRDLLNHSSYEMKFRPGMSNEGGDGCTIVDFV